MDDSKRYRANASECLLASYDEASQPYGKLNFSMALFWLVLAREDEAINNLLASWGIAESIETDGLVRSRVPHTTLQQHQFPRAA